MNDAAGFVSTVALIIFVLALLFLVVLFFVRPGTLDETETEAVLGDDIYDSNLDEKLEDATKFLYEMVVRENERLIQNIDAIDNALIAIVVGITAVALFASDKFEALLPAYRIVGFLMLGVSAVATIAGYFFYGGKEFAPLDSFVVDFASAPDTATLAAIESQIVATAISRRVRRRKRACVVLATALVVVASICVIVGKALGEVGG